MLPHCCGSWTPMPRKGQSRYVHQRGAQLRGGGDRQRADELRQHIFQQDGPRRSR